MTWDVAGISFSNSIVQVSTSFCKVIALASCEARLVTGSLGQLLTISSPPGFTLNATSVASDTTKSFAFSTIVFVGSETVKLKKLI